MRNFTPEDLIEYKYGGMDAHTAAELEKMLATNWALREKLAVISEAANRLDRLLVAPREQAVERIVAYASMHHAESI